MSPLTQFRRLVPINVIPGSKGAEGHGMTPLLSSLKLVSSARAARELMMQKFLPIVRDAMAQSPLDMPLRGGL